MPTLNGPLRGAQIEARVEDSTNDPRIPGIIFLKKPSEGADGPWDLLYNDGTGLRTLHDDAKAQVGGFRVDQLIQAFVRVAVHEPATPAPATVALAADNAYQIGSPPAHLAKGGSTVLRIAANETDGTQGYDPVVLFNDDLLALDVSYPGSEALSSGRFVRLTLVQEGRPVKASLLLARGPANSDGSAPLLIGRDDGGGALDVALRELSGLGGGGTIPKEGLAQIKALIEAATGANRVSNQAFKDAPVSVLYTGTDTPPGSFLSDARPGSLCVRETDQALFVKEAATERGVAIASRDTVSVTTGSGGAFQRGSSGTSPTDNGVDRNPSNFVGEVQAAQGTSGDDVGQYKWTLWVLASDLSGNDPPFNPAALGDGTANFLAAINSGATLPDTRTDRVLFYRKSAQDKSLGGANYLAFETRGFETSFGLSASTRYNFKFFKDQRGTPAYVFPAQTETTVPGGWKEQVSTAGNTALEVAHARPVSVMEQTGTGGATTLAVGATGRDIEHILPFDPDSIDDEDELGLAFDTGTNRLALSRVKQGEWLEIVGSCKFRHRGEAGTAVFKLVELRSNGSPVIGGETDLVERDLPAASSWTTYHLPAVRTRARKRGDTDVFTFHVDFKRSSTGAVATATSIEAVASANHDTVVGFEKTVSRGVENLQSGQIYFRDKTNASFSSYNFVSDMPGHDDIAAGAAGEFLRLNAAKNGYELHSPELLNFGAAAADTDRRLKFIVQETQESQQGGTRVSFTQDSSPTTRWVGSAAADSNLVVIWNSTARREGLDEAAYAVPANSFVVGYPANHSGGNSAWTAVAIHLNGQNAQRTYTATPFPSASADQHRWLVGPVDPNGLEVVRAGRTLFVFDFQRRDGSWLFGTAPTTTTRTITKEVLQNVAKGAPPVNSPPVDAVEGTRVDLLVDWTEPRGGAVVTLGQNTDHSFTGFGASVGSSDRTLRGVDFVGAGQHNYRTTSLRDRVFVARSSNMASAWTELWDGNTKYDLTPVSGLPHYYQAATADARTWVTGRKKFLNLKAADNTWAVDPETIKKGIIAYTGFRWVDDSGVTAIVESLVKAYARVGANTAMTLADKNEEVVTSLPSTPVANRIYYRTGAAPLSGKRSELVCTFGPFPTSGLGANNNVLTLSMSLASGIQTKYPGRFVTGANWVELYMFNTSRAAMAPLPDDILGIYFEFEVGGTRIPWGQLMPFGGGGADTRNPLGTVGGDNSHYYLIRCATNKTAIVRYTEVNNEIATGDFNRKVLFRFQNNGSSRAFPANTNVKMYLARG